MINFKEPHFSQPLSLLCDLAFISELISLEIPEQNKIQYWRKKNLMTSPKIEQEAKDSLKLSVPGLKLNLTVVSIGALWALLKAFIQTTL